jgi:hypothetical protein
MYNPYSQIDQQTLGMLGSAGIDPAAVSQPQQPQGYPTYPNAAGVGSQTAGQTPAAPATQAPAAPKVEMPDTTSRGMSPYSLVGESNYR